MQKDHYDYVLVAQGRGCHIAGIESRVVSGVSDYVSLRGAAVLFAQFIEQYKRGIGYIHAIDKNGEQSAFCFASKNPVTKSGFIAFISVDPSCRGNGLARMLLKCVGLWLGCNRLFLASVPTKLNFFGKFGFTVDTVQDSDSFVSMSKGQPFSADRPQLVLQLPETLSLAYKKRYGHIVNKNSELETRPIDNFLVEKGDSTKDLMVEEWTESPL